MKKIIAILRIITAGRSLESKMKLVLFMQGFYIHLAQDLQDTATKKGQLHTLQALRTVVNERLDK